MCGICGSVGASPQSMDELHRMMDRIAHRGPDAEGKWASGDGCVLLGHRRLAIVGLGEGGAQPMESADGAKVLCYNGEIYNFRDFRKDLVQAGCVFRGGSDSEVLLELACRRGLMEVLPELKGMFALGLYDQRARKLTLVRDRIGEKPLYYGFVGENFVFASELSALMARRDFSGDVDRRVLPVYLRHGYIPAPYTIYRGVRKLRPGESLVLDEEALRRESEVLRALPDPERRLAAALERGVLTLRRWYSLREVARQAEADPFTGSFHEAADELERLLRGAIRDQMLADVPVGAFLSAGIDSGTVAALMQQESSAPIRTFTIGMPEKGFDESAEAAAIAAHLGTQHCALTITEKDALGVVEKLPGMFSEPFGDSSAIPTYLVSALTRQHTTVALTGDGGDELFGGYNSYGSVLGAYRKAAKIPYGLRKAAGSVLLGLMGGRSQRARIRGTLLTLPGSVDYYRYSYESDELVNALALPTEDAIRVLEDPGVMRDSLKALMLSDLELYHPEDILVKVDRCAMAVALEGRIPMLDRDVVRFALSLPAEYLRDETRGKLVLREVLYRYVPKELMERPKKGFGIPLQDWLKTDALRPWAEDLLSPEKLRRENLVSAEAAQALWQDFIENGNYRSALWHLLMLEAWLENFGVDL